MKSRLLLLIGLTLGGFTLARSDSPAPPAQGPVFVADILVGSQRLPLYRQVTPTSTEPPIYPYDDRRHGISGEVSVGAVVEPDGKVSAVFVTAAKASSAMQHAAMACVRKWTFPPMLKDGKPIRYAAETPIVFNVEAR